MTTLHNKLHDEIKRAARWIASANRLLILTGAGVSKESGIPTFRDSLDGLWARYDPAELATPEAFARNPKLVWDWYAHRRSVAETCKPNPAHHAIAQLDDILPWCVVVTQNVDGFHKLAGSMDVIELHGNLGRYRCSANCQGAPTIIPVTVWQVDYVPICPACGAFARPDIVWFGEALPPAAIDRALDLAQKCDVMLVVGTSGQVMPAAALPGLAQQNKATIIDVNPNPDALGNVVDIFLQGAAGEVMPLLVEAIKAEL